jgi:hypothetical protein
MPLVTRSMIAVGVATHVMVSITVVVSPLAVVSIARGIVGTTAQDRGCKNCCES